jgi:ankyrin repeat protein
MRQAPISHAKLVDGLHDAAINSNLYKAEDVRWLLQFAPGNLIIPDYRRRTALHVATENQLWDCMQLLVDRGADIDACADDDVGTALHCAVNYRDHDSVKLLIEMGADVNVPDIQQYETPAHVAARGSLECLRLLVQAGCDLDAYSELGYTPLLTSVAFRATDNLKFLLESRAPHDVDAQGNTAVVLAIRNNGWECMRMLVLHGASVAAYDSTTPLELVANLPADRAGVVASAVEFLVSAGADVGDQLLSVLERPEKRPLLEAAARGAAARAAFLSIESTSAAQQRVRNLDHSYQPKAAREWEADAAVKAWLPESDGSNLLALEISSLSHALAAYLAAKRLVTTLSEELFNVWRAPMHDEIVRFTRTGEGREPVKNTLVARFAVAVAKLVKCKEAEQVWAEQVRREGVRLVGSRVNAERALELLNDALHR